MGFFDRFYYGKAGKRDYTEMDMPKNRVSLFFLVFKDHFFDLIKVNALQLVFWVPFLIWTFMNVTILQSIDTQAVLGSENGESSFLGVMTMYLITWLVGCVPCIVITGPSSAGAAYIMRNWARDQHAFLFSDFKDAFKSNWKQALGVSLIEALVPLLGCTAFAFYAKLAVNNTLMLLPMILTLTVLVLWALMLMLIYPLMVGYELSFKALLKNALLMSAACFPQMLLARLITSVPVVLLFVAVYIGNPMMLMIVCMYYLLFGFALSRLIYASFAHGVFDKYLNPHIEGAVVGQGLRPHSDDDDELFDDDDEDEYEDTLDEDEA